MSKFSDLFCLICILVVVIGNIFVSFDAGEPLWIIIYFVVDLSILLIYHYFTKDQMSKKWELKKSQDDLRNNTK